MSQARRSRSTHRHSFRNFCSKITSDSFSLVHIYDGNSEVQHNIIHENGVVPSYFAFMVQKEREKIGRTSADLP